MNVVNLPSILSFTQRADAAAEEAIAMVSRLKLARKPVAMLSEDGFLTLQWQSEEQGAALIFAGDGTVSVAVSNSDRFYAESLIEIKVTDALPSTFYDNYRS